MYSYRTSIKSDRSDELINTYLLRPIAGIIVGLLAQGYTPKEASITGVFLHGRSGDLALQLESEESLLAGDIISNLGRAFRSVRDSLPATDF